MTRVLLVDHFSMNVGKIVRVPGLNIEKNNFPGILRKVFSANYVAIEERGEWTMYKCRYMPLCQSLRFKTIQGIIAFINAINIDNGVQLVEEVHVEEVCTMKFKVNI